MNTLDFGFIYGFVVGFYIADAEDCEDWGIDWGFSLQLGIFSISYCSGIKNPEDIEEKK